MNISYQQNRENNSNNDIISVYFYSGVKRVPLWQKALDRALSYLAIMVSFLCGARVRTVARVTAVALSLVGLVGVIGAMEAGTLALPLGIVIGAALILIEYLCLRRH